MLVIRPSTHAKKNHSEIIVHEPILSLQLSQSPTRPDYFLVQTTIELQEQKIEDQRNYVLFIVDRSASMKINNRIECAKKSLIKMIEALPDNTHIQIITFDQHAQIFHTGKKSELYNLKQKINDMNTGSGTNFSAPFDLVDPDFFQSEYSFISFLTDGQNFGKEEPPVIMRRLKSTFSKKFVKMPTITTICVGQEADVRITVQFDYPMRRGFYAESPERIENEFKKMHTLVGKPFFPIHYSMKTEAFTREEEVGYIQTSGKFLNCFSIPKKELEKKPFVNCTFTIGRTGFKFAPELPHLNTVAYNPHIIELYFIKKIEDAIVRKNELAVFDEIKLIKKAFHLLEKEKKFKDNYAHLLNFIRILQYQYTDHGYKKIDNSIDSTVIGYIYTLNTGAYVNDFIKLPIEPQEIEQQIKQPELFEIKQFPVEQPQQKELTESKESKENESLEEEELLLFPYYNEDMVELIQKRKLIAWNPLAQHKLISFTRNPYLLNIAIDPEDISLRAWAKGIETNDIAEIIYTIKNKFHAEDLRNYNITHFISLTTCLAEGRGNSLILALLCAYVIAIKIENKNLTLGTVKTLYGIDDDIEKIHYWCIYQTTKHIYLFDPTNENPYSLVDLLIEKDRIDLINYYKNRQLSGVLRDTLATLNLSHPDQNMVSFPDKYTDEANKHSVPDSLTCSVTKKLIKTPVYIHDVNAVLDFSNIHNSKYGMLLEPTKNNKVIPASDQIQKIKFFICQNVDLSHLQISKIIPKKKVHFSSYPYRSTQELSDTNRLTSILQPRQIMSDMPLEEKESNTLFLYKSLNNELVIIFVSENARNQFLKINNIGLDKCFLKYAGYDDRLFLPFSTGRRGKLIIEFSEPNTMQHFINALHLKETPSTSEKEVTHFNIGCYFTNKNYSNYDYQPYDNQKILVFDRQAPVFGYPLYRSELSPPKFAMDFYIALTRDTMEVIDRNEFLQRSQALRAEINKKKSQIDSFPSISMSISSSPDPLHQNCLMIAPIVKLPEIKTEKIPANFILLINIGKSMKGDKLKIVKEGLKNLIQKKHSPIDNIQIIVFEKTTKSLYSGKFNKIQADKINFNQTTGLSNLAAAFESIDPNFFGDVPGTICLITDGIEATSADTILALLEKTFKSKKKTIPSILTITVGEQSRVENNKQFDRPVQRGLYAKNRTDIVKCLSDVLATVGKTFFPVVMEWETKEASSKLEIGSVQQGDKIQNVCHFPIRALENQSIIICNLSVGEKKYEYEWKVPNLNIIQYNKNIITLYFAKLLSNLSKDDIVSLEIIKRIQRNLAQREPLAVASLNENQNKNIENIITTLQTKKNKSRHNENILSSTITNFIYRVTTGKKLPEMPVDSKVVLKAKKIPTPNYKTLSLNLFNEDIFDLVNRQLPHRWIIKLNHKAVDITFDSEDISLKIHAEKNIVTFTEIENIFSYVNTILVNEADLPNEESLTNLVAEQKGNVLTKVLFCAYLIAFNIKAKTFPLGSVRIFSGIDDTCNYIHFWCVYETKDFIYLMDPNINNKYCFVNLANSTESTNLVDYYNKIGLSGILRDTFRLFEYPYPDKSEVSLPEKLIQKLKHNIIPDELKCPLTNTLMKTPVYVGNNNLAFDKENICALNKAKSLNSDFSESKMTPASLELQQIKHFFTQTISSADLKMKSLKECVLAIEIQTKHSFYSSQTNTMFTSREKKISMDSSTSSSSNEMIFVFADKAKRNMFLKESKLENEKVFKKSSLDDRHLIIMLTPVFKYDAEVSIVFEKPENLIQFLTILAIEQDKIESGWVFYQFGKDPSLKCFSYNEFPNILYFGDIYNQFKYKNTYYIDAVDGYFKIVPKEIFKEKHELNTQKFSLNRTV
jgi:uncharacterized protein YegL